MSTPTTSDNRPVLLEDGGQCAAGAVRAPVTPTRDARPCVLRQEAVLVAVSVVWGATFLITQRGLAYTGPLGFVAVRFGVATLVMLAFTGRRLHRFTRHEAVAGLALGGALFGGYVLQTVGLQSIPSSTSAFLTALYVPLVPLLTWLLSGRAPNKRNWLGIALAFSGVALLSGVSGGSLGLGIGEVATLLGAVVIAFEILATEHFAPRVDVRRMTVLALATCSVLATAAVPVAGERLPTPSWGLALTAGLLGVATAAIQWAIAWAQRSVPAVRATVIFAGEPMWGGVFGALAGDPFTAATFAGAGLIISSLVLPALRPRAAGHRHRTGA